jgi:hypothetical protein
MNIKEIVNDVEWQALRQSFIGMWKKQPAANVQKLIIYLKDRTDPLRVRRVHNYLTGSGFRLRIISDPSIDQLLNELRAVKI